ncbi:MAG: tetratricopeptide repeat protein [Longimicrobiales bacterium]|nr:tetratricopeptide repeat protein [Longimicrobiales bacterium]
MSRIVLRGTAPLLAASVSILLAACGFADEAPTDSASRADVPLYDDLGDYRRAVTTTSDEARAYFDQGLRLQYAFNHPEAIRSYERALTADPDCAICWWGIALAAGPNINAPMDEAGAARATEAVERALALADGATPVERGLIEALARRYGPDPIENRAAQDSAWAEAMLDLATAYPADPDVLTLATASIMNLSPWNYWTGPYDARDPRPGTETAVDLVEAVLGSDPNHPGACHYLIHAVEAAFPERAVECADRLAALMPGAGHIVHMPGHIYLRVGRYADAVEANRHAVHADETYIADLGPIDIYTSAYYPHNYHFMNFAATMAGMSEVAIESAAMLPEKIRTDVAEGSGRMQLAVPVPQLTAVTFARWDEVLAAELPPATLLLSVMLDHYARGVAHAALGDFEAARAYLDSVRVTGGEVLSAPALLDMAQIPTIAEHALAGEIALRSGDADAAVEHFTAARNVEDGMVYIEPPNWYYPVRWSLGRALLEAGRPAEAEQAYRESLLRFRDNGWSLYGLAACLEAQGKTAEAAEARAAFERAWAAADVEITASRM